MMHEPQFVQAKSVDQAIAALCDADGDGLVVAGGIVVGSLFNQRLASPSVLVDISRIDTLRHITRTSEGLAIGALATHDDILRSEDLKAVAPLLAEIAADVSCPRLRNRGTLGGSLCTVGGQGDPATGLIALGAKMHIHGPNGSRSAAVEEFYKDAFVVDLRPDEIVERISVPKMPSALRYGFYKIGPRNAMDWTQITASVVFAVNEGIVANLRIGMNGVANTPSRPRKTEELINGCTPGAIDWEGVSKTLNNEISPQGDLVYSEELKRHLATITIRRAFEHAIERVQTVGART
jgi:aerobic carbon-monoxide dehydrogenase medium subunit